MLPKILVCGSRHVDHASKEEYQKVAGVLDGIVEDRGWVTEPDEYGNWLPAVIVIDGACPQGGIDSLAHQWAVVNWCQSERYPPKFGMVKDYGFAIAAKARNQQMLDEENPDLVVAFPGGRGTMDMIDRAQRAGVEVVEIR